MGIDAELEAEWPNLANTKYEITSKHTSEYNCLAWAANENDRWWSPLPEDDYYWPEGAPREETVQAFIIAFQICGYELYSNGELEHGFEKIAIYVTADGKPQHIAKQLDDGMWSSKLGCLEDIKHELDGLEGKFYGTVQQFMRRAY